MSQSEHALVPTSTDAPLTTTQFASALEEAPLVPDEHLEGLSTRDMNPGYLLRSLPKALLIDPNPEAVKKYVDALVDCRRTIANAEHRLLEEDRPRYDRYIEVARKRTELTTAELGVRTGLLELRRLEVERQLVETELKQAMLGQAALDEELRLRPVHYARREKEAQALLVQQEAHLVEERNRLAALERQGKADEENAAFQFARQRENMEFTDHVDRQRQLLELKRQEEEIEKGRLESEKVRAEIHKIRMETLLLPLQLTGGTSEEYLGDELVEHVVEALRGILGPQGTDSPNWPMIKEKYEKQYGTVTVNEITRRLAPTVPKEEMLEPTPETTAPEMPA